MRFSCYLSVILRNYRLNFARSTPTLYSVAATRTRFNLSKGMYNLQRAAKATPANPIKLWSGWFCGSWLAWQLQWCASVCTGMQFDSSLLLFICVCCVHGRFQSIEYEVRKKGFWYFNLFLDWNAQPENKDFVQIFAVHFLQYMIIMMIIIITKKFALF